MRPSAALALLAAATGCASSPPDVRGQWAPLNRYADTPVQIPLQRTRVFAPSPLDGTLKNMLLRWSADAQMKVAYLLPTDFTLHQGVAGVRTADLSAAAHQLTQAYADQGVLIQIENNVIVVRAPEAEAPAPVQQPHAHPGAAL